MLPFYAGQLPYIPSVESYANFPPCVFVVQCSFKRRNNFAFTLSDCSYSFVFPTSEFHTLFHPD